MSTCDFCNHCGNLLYYTSQPGLGADYELARTCRQCGTSTPVNGLDEMIEFGDEDVDNVTLLKEKYMNNHYLEHDNTIPRVVIDCVDPQCKGKRALYILYDEQNMQTIYQCLTCKKWFS